MTESETVADKHDDTIPAPIGYAVSNRKFWVMSLFSFGLYLILWAYKNFRSLGVPGPNKLGSGVYAIFFPISFFDLLKNVEKESVKHDIPFHLNKLLIAVMYFLFSGAAKLLARSEETALLSLVPATISLVIAYFGHRKILEVNKKLGAEIDSKFTFKDLIFIVIALVIVFSIG